MNKRLCFALLLFVALASAAAASEKSPAEADPAPATAPQLHGSKWDLILYGGTYTATDFADIIWKFETDYRPSYLSAVALNWETPARLRSLRFETEGQIVQHTGLMNHQELNAVMVARWNSFVPYLPISVAFAEGLSYASEVPSLETREVDWGKLRFVERKSNQWLNYFYLELDYALPLYQEYHPRLLFRIHHRSGVFGTYCEFICGSNFITYGVKLGM